MLRGFDVSSRQKDFQIQDTTADFVISKATEGLTYVNPYCDGVIQRAIKSNKLFGFYHFGRNNDPIKECDWFIKNCEGYFNHGIPILDWEKDQSVEWVNEFVRRVHEKTRVWPWIYANPWRFNQGGVEPNCGRWIAQYPKPKQVMTLYDDPGDHLETDGLVCCWQYSELGAVNGWDVSIDLNHFFGDRSAWEAYAHAVSVDAPTNQSILENNDYKVVIEKK